MSKLNPSLSVEKIGGTSMSEYEAVRDNIILYPENPYNRIFVVSAYGGITDDLLEHKKNNKPGVYGLFANDDVNEDWRIALDQLSLKLNKINANLFADSELRQQANDFIDERIAQTKQLLNHLQDLCRHGHFSLETHLLTVRELLASIGEAHSAWNLTHLLQAEGLKARLIDLTGWQSEEPLALDDMIHQHFEGVDFTQELPIVTGYTHCKENLMYTFDRGYSEMTFSRIAVLCQATEAVIHKEYHLSSADPRLVGEGNVVPIGRTNYDIADQLANLGMEAIHPKAAQGLRLAQIPLRIKNTFDPAHHGTLFTEDYVSESPQVEIIAGMRNLIALELFDQEMMGQQGEYEKQMIDTSRRLTCEVITKDFNANTITLYLNTSLKKAKRLSEQLQQALPTASIRTSKIALASAMGSDMRIKGLLAKAVQTLFDQGINVEAIQQNMRQVEMQFFVNETDYDKAIKSLHENLIEVHDHGKAICEH
ncbi:aspartate kinase [Hydrogenovibrio sp. SC-1]|uniref:aspartate kinase n=1 Tax=Hydrogenovibrio sp. SC-1 TaxID=2065820 RepID=UPI000C7AD3BE|nr:aspartate kinase [Hydrogenovibrio sp. SC-1]PLA75448.1 aspartate kinase [Hydrogenovibrio sp. SC-1]